jgi:hypothetical protein
VVVRRGGIPASSFTDFATLLRVLRRRARLTQRELGIAVGYSEAQLYLLSTALNRAGAVIFLDNAHPLDGEQATRSLTEHLVSSSRAAFAAISREDIALPGFEPFRLGGLTRAEAGMLIERLSGSVLPAQLSGRLIARTDGNPMLIRLALGQVKHKHRRSGGACRATGGAVRRLRLPAAHHAGRPERGGPAANRAARRLPPSGRPAR